MLFAPKMEGHKGKEANGKTLEQATQPNKKHHQQNFQNAHITYKEKHLSQHTVEFMHNNCC